MSCGGRESLLVPMTSLTISDLDGHCMNFNWIHFSSCMQLVFTHIRLRRHVHGLNTKELMDAWNNKDKRILSEQFENACHVRICCLLVSAWFKTLVLQICDWGQQMKEKLVATGSLDQVDVLAKQLYQKTVTNTSKEKPVTKKMLAEQWHWDEFLGWKLIALSVVAACLFESMHVVTSRFVNSNTNPLSWSELYDRQCLGMGQAEWEAFQASH